MTKMDYRAGLLVVVILVLAVGWSTSSRTARLLRHQRDVLYTQWVAQYDLSQAVEPLQSYLTHPDPQDLDRSLAALLEAGNQASIGFSEYFQTDVGALAAVSAARQLLRGVQAAHVDAERRNQVVRLVAEALEKLQSDLSPSASERGDALLPSHSRLWNESYVRKSFGDAVNSFRNARGALR